MQNRTNSLFCLVLVLLTVSPCTLLGIEAGKKPDLNQLREVVSRSQTKLAKTTASWTMVFETSSGIEAHVKVNSTPMMLRYVVSAFLKGKEESWIDIIYRDGAWYVFDGQQSAKYRPYEAPTDIPSIYMFLEQAMPGFTDMEFLDSKGTFEVIEENVAKYRVPISDAPKQQVETSLQQINNLLKKAAEENSLSASIQGALNTKRTLEDLLHQGIPIKVDLETGFVVQSGIVGKRVWLRDFHWDKKFDSTVFNVDNRQWIDHTKMMEAANPTDIIMIKHFGVWRPGQPSGDMETKLWNYKTGEIRRVPYTGCQCTPLCFSQDRKRVYVGGLILDTVSMGLYEINLENLTQRQLGLPFLNRGFIMFGALSPDSKTLAVTQIGTNENPLFQQVVLVNLESGKTTLLGEPLDCAYLSWLPDGAGLILVSRKTRHLDQIPDSTVCRMDLKGNLTTLLKGDLPVALTPRPLILFLGENRLWMTCDLVGKEVKSLLEGLKGFNFPTPSPDGNQLIMMKFGGDKGPQPHLVDLISGKIIPLSVKPGLWAFPTWR